MTVPGASSKILTAAVEYVCITMNGDDLSQLVTKSMDKLDDSIEEARKLSLYDNDDNTQYSRSYSETNLNVQSIEDQTENYFDNSVHLQTTTESDETEYFNSQLAKSELDKQLLTDVGDHVEVLWPAESTCFTGIVT